MYTRDRQTVAVGAGLLAVAAVFQVFDAIQGVGTGALRGLGKTRGPMVVNLIAFGVIGLPIGYSLCFKTLLGIYGLWTGLTLALIFAAALVLSVWLKQSKVARFTLQRRRRGINRSGQPQRRFADAMA